MKQQPDSSSTIKQESREKMKDENILFSYTLKEDEQPDSDFFDTIQKTIDTLCQAKSMQKDLFVTIESIESSLLTPNDGNNWRLDLTQEKKGIIALQDVTHPNYKMEIPIETLRSIVIRKSKQ